MRKNIYVGILFTSFGLSSCVPVVIMNPYPSGGGEHKEDKHESKDERHEAYGIPKGHLPPPGHCRIWYPNKPAGHQPPPQRCPIPLRQIPLGAYVVSRLEGDNKRALVHVYSGQKPGVVVDTRHYNVTD
jgi:hypothetical protein